MKQEGWDCGGGGKGGVEAQGGGGEGRGGGAGGGGGMPKETRERAVQVREMLLEATETFIACGAPTGVFSVLQAHVDLLRLEQDLLRQLTHPANHPPTGNSQKSSI
jgi:hypothetical protein